MILCFVTNGGWFAISPIRDRRIDPEEVYFFSTAEEQAAFLAFYKRNPIAARFAYMTAPYRVANNG